MTDDKRRGNLRPFKELLNEVAPISDDKIDFSNPAYGLKPLVNELDHPCRDTCSGWRQGYDRGFAKGRDQMVDPDRYLDALRIQDAERALEAERARSAKLQEENEKLRYDAQKIYADYMDRGAAMRETGDIVRSLYAPKNERLNKEVGKLIQQLKTERAWSANLVEAIKALRDGHHEEIGGNMDKLFLTIKDL